MQNNAGHHYCNSFCTVHIDDIERFGFFSRGFIGFGEKVSIHSWNGDLLQTKFV